MANPTTNYGWPMPTSGDLVTDLPADFDAFGQPVDTTLKALNPETTLGDIAYRSAVSNTNTRLGIGSDGQVLAVSGGVPAWTTTADVTPLTTKGDLFTFTTEDARIGVGADGTVLTAASGEATGLEWAAPASGGLTISEVATGTITSTIKLQITGLSSYDQIFFKINAVNTTGSVAYPNFTINDSTSGVYFEYSTKNESNNTNSNNYIMAYNGTSKIFNTYNPMASGDTGNYFFLILTNCKSTGFTYFQYGNFYLTNVASTYGTQAGSGVFASAAAVSSIEFLNDGGGSANYTGGTYKVWAG